MDEIRLMLVEAGTGSCSWMDPLINQCGYTVVARAHDGGQAVRIARRNGVDVVFLDCASGNRDKVARIAKELRAQEGIPAILLADSPTEGQQMIKAVGGSFLLLVKPSSAAELRLAVTATRNDSQAEKQIRALRKDLQNLKSHTDAIIEQRTARLKKINAQLHRLLYYLEVTERKLAIDALDLDFNTSKIIPESGESGIITIGTDMQVVLVSEVAGRMLGRSIRECTGSDISTVLVCEDSAQASRMTNAIRSILASGSEREALDIPIITHNGNTLALSIGLEPIMGENDHICGVLMALGDARQGLDWEYERIMRQYPASLNLMVKGIAHDLNNILSSVLANVQLARATIGQGTGAYDRLNLAEESILRAHELSEQMLTYSADLSSYGKPADLEEIIRNILLNSAYPPKALCSFSIADDVRGMPLDEDLIRQIFSYLFEFLFGFIPENEGIKISADTIISGTPDHKMLSPADYVRIRMSAEHFTMPKKEIQMLFLAGSSPATAVDLSVAESMLRKAGGVLHLHPHAESGIGITLYFPAHYQKVSPEIREIAVHPALMKNGNRQKILLMDDEDAILSATSEMLKFLGYDIVVSHDGDEALKIYRDAIRSRKPFDAVILDITIPGGLGAQETLPRLRELDPSVRAIISSGYSTNPMIVDCQSFGYMAAIIKPYGFRELGEALDMTFQKK